MPEEDFHVEGLQALRGLEATSPVGPLSDIVISSAVIGAPCRRRGQEPRVSFSLSFLLSFKYFSLQSSSLLFRVQTLLLLVTASGLE